MGPDLEQRTSVPGTPPDDPPGSPTAQGSAERVARRRYLAAGVLVLALFALATWHAATRLGMTVDEPLYLASGLVLWDGATWDHPYLQFHGPLALWPNHLFLDGLRMAELQVDPGAHVVRARLGMLGFGVLGGVLAFALAWRGYGPRGGLLGLLAYALHPMVLGYSALCNVDAAHATTVLLSVFAVWGFARRPNAARAAGVGATLGLLLCVKYLAVLAVPGLALVAFVAGARRGPARLVGTAALALATLLVTMHAVYAFRGGFANADPDAFATPALASLAALPGLGRLLALLPGAWLAGLDMVGSFQGYDQLTWLAGEQALVHRDYFVRSIWLKSPELWSALVLLALVGLPGALGPRRRRREGWLDLLLLAAILPPLLYMSLVAEIQSGIRYVHQSLVPLCVLAGSVATFRVWRAVPARGLAAFAAVAIGWQVLETVRNAPDHLSYFTPTSGGRLASLRVFRDSNNDFGQWEEEGIPVLRERYGDALRILAPGDGPMLGRVAAYVGHLVPPDVERPGSARHWTDRLDPVDAVGAGWFVFEVSAEDLEESAREFARAGDERGWLDLAVALAAEGELDRARAALEPISAERSGALRDLLERLRGRAPGSTGPDVALARAWSLVGRPDRAIAELGPEPQRLDARDALAQAHMLRRDYEAAARVLDRPEVLEQAPYLALAAAGAWFRSGFADRALELIEAHADRLPEALRPTVDELRAKIEERRSGMEHFGIAPKPR